MGSRSPGVALVRSHRGRDVLVNMSLGASEDTQQEGLVVALFLLRSKQGAAKPSGEAVKAAYVPRSLANQEDGAKSLFFFSDSNQKYKKLSQYSSLQNETKRKCSRSLLTVCPYQLFLH